jgi:pimeloyl-ACP methyl ester carboxylesterase
MMPANASTPASPSSASSSAPTRRYLPLILIRGFGGLGVEDEKKIAYQGFNDGTVYPQKRGENYIYEGLILRFLKLRPDWRYHDATNVVGYYAKDVADEPEELDDPRLKKLAKQGFFKGRVVIDPGMARSLLDTTSDPCRTLWVFRYYDLDDRKFQIYGAALVRLIDFIRALAASQGGRPPRVNVIAHSMGGLLVREAIQRTYPEKNRRAEDFINKVVTLGTPHQGISFQLLGNWIPGIRAEEELEHFSPEFQAKKSKPESYVNLHKFFPLERLLTVVGTNYRTYDVGIASKLNRFFSVPGEFGPTYNRSDGLVKQAYAEVPGAPRTFVHKCHGGFDSLVTSREAFEIAHRFFVGDLRARLSLVKAAIKRGMDVFGKSEFFFGVSIKPRRVDFELFHQSAEAENCYGPFHTLDLTDNLTDKKSPGFPWAGPDQAQRLIWEGWLDTRAVPEPKTDVVLRLDFYLGERDRLGIGFSDNVVFRKQYYIRALFGQPLRLYLYPDERFMTPGFTPADEDRMREVGGGWEFSVLGTGFEGTFRIELDRVPEEGEPVPFGS